MQYPKYKEQTPSNVMKNRVFIVAGGPSVNDIDLNLLTNENTIVINNGIFYVPNPTHFITMDYSFLSKIDLDRFDKIPCNSKIFVANTYPDYIEKKDGKYIDKRTNMCYTLNRFNGIIESNTYRYFKFDEMGFSSGKNSGFCALQFALQLRYKEIYLLGYDYKINNKSHFHGGYGEERRKFEIKLQEYFNYIREAIENYKGESKIFSCSKTSKLNCILEYKKLEKVING